MAEIALDGAGVVPIVGEREAAGMAQHGGGKGDLPALQAAQGAQLAEPQQ